MIRSAVALGVVLTLAIPAAASWAQAPPLPSCPDEEDKLTTYTPGFGKPGKSGVYIVELRGDDTEAESITNLTLTIRPREGTPSTTPLEADYDGTKAILPAPAEGRDFTVVFEWDQDAGTPAACHGDDTYVLPLLPVQAKVGDPFATRLWGRYRAVSTPVNYEGKRVRARWTLRPGCDYFACSTRLTSNRGLRGRLRLLDSGSYRLTVKLGVVSDSCQVTRVTSNTFTGEELSRETDTIPRAFRAEQRLSLRIRRTKNGRGETFSGKLTTTYTPTARARARDCTKTRSYVDRVSGRRL